MKRSSTSLAIIAAVILLSGCTTGDTSLVPVSGTAELDGKPLAGASLAFIAGGGGVLSTATTDKEGRFSAKVGAGLNKVGVSKVDALSAAPEPINEEDALMGTEEEVRALVAKQPKSIVPDRYADPNTSGISFDIRGGMEPIMLSLSSK